MSSMVEMMTGRAIKEREGQAAPSLSSNNRVLEVQNLSLEGVYDQVSFSVHKGEILSIFGLLGSGQTTLTRSIFGVERYDSGAISIHGKPVTIRSPQDAKHSGIGFVPIDRKVSGMIMGQSVRKNITLSNWHNISTLGFFRQPEEKRHVQQWIEALGIRMAGGMEVAIRFLSGGNQQKSVLARWLEAKVDVLILNEPTWGVDVGARSDIYDQLDQLASTGLAILIVSSDIQEVLAISQRIITMYKGRITGEFNRTQTTQSQILAAAAGDIQS